MSRESEYRANRELADTPRRRVNRDYAPPTVTLDQVIKVMGWLTAGLVLIAFAKEIGEWVSHITTELRAAIEARSSVG